MDQCLDNLIFDAARINPSRIKGDLDRRRFRVMVYREDAGLLSDLPSNRKSEGRARTIQSLMREDQRICRRVTEIDGNRRSILPNPIGSRGRFCDLQLCLARIPVLAFQCPEESLVEPRSALQVTMKANTSQFLFGNDGDALRFGER